jgi:hypothetical protein
MSEEIIYWPTFTGNAQWFRRRDPEHAFFTFPVSRAIYRNDYRELAISFEGMPQSANADEIGNPTDLVLTWQDGLYKGGGGIVSCELRRGVPDITKLKGLWLVSRPAYKIVPEKDEEDVYQEGFDEREYEGEVEQPVDEIPVTQESEITVKMFLRPFQVIVS